MLRPAPIDPPAVDAGPPGRGSGCEHLDGATAIVRGALDAGADFFAGYPTTPAAPILSQALRALPSRGGVAIQAEDEIASLSMCLGAALGGARAFTATGGPDASLRGEGVSLAFAGEVPLVVIDVQRLGGAAGRRSGAARGLPIIALSPSTVAECRTVTMRAFDLAERFRCPVFVMTDEELAFTTRPVPIADLEQRVPVRRRCVGASPQEDRRPNGYVPAHGTSRPAPAPVGARYRRLAEEIAAHAEETAFVAADLQEGARTLLIGYGMGAVAMREAAVHCRKDGGRVSALTLHTLWPVPEAAIERALPGIDRIVVAERVVGEYRGEIERVAGARARVVELPRTGGASITPEAIRDAIL